jgi:non-heme chloroperoxidase
MSSQRSPAHLLMPSPMKSLSINGIQLHWLEEGAGQALVLMPGAIGDCRAWTHQMGDFAQHFRTIALSRRYAWPSRYVPGGDGSIGPCIADLLGLMQHLGLEKISLVGHSYGGYICLVFAHKYPHLVQKLVLVEPTVFPYITHSPQNPLTLLPLACRDFGSAASFFKMGFFGLRPCKAALARGDFDAARMAFFKAIVSGKMDFEAAHPILQQQLRDNIEAFQGENDPFIYPFRKTQVREVATPTLILQGGQSPRWFGHICRQLRRDMPCAALQKLETPTHWLHLDGAEEFNRAVIEFLKN